MLSYISRIIQVVIGLTYMPLMIRLLGQSEFGLYNIAASLVAYLGILNFGFGSSYVRFFSRYKASKEDDKIETLNGMFLILFSVLGLLAVVAGVILAFNVDIVFGPSLDASELQRMRILMLILVINLAVSFPNIVFDNYAQAHERFIFQNGLEIARQVSSPLLSLPLLLAGYGSVGMVVATTVVNVTAEILTVVYCVNKLDMKFSFGTWDNVLFKELSYYSFFIFINMVVDQVNNNVDKMILGRYQGAVVTAVYSIGANLNAYYTQLSLTIANVFTPRIHRMEATHASNEEMTGLFTRVGRIQFILLSLVLSGFVFFGRPFISIWAGEGYDNSYFVALILMATIMIPLIQNLGIEIQRAKNKHQFRSWLYIGMAVGNIIITLPLSIRFGAIGAAIGTALSYLIGNGLLMNLYNHYKIGLDMKYFWKAILTFLPAFIIPVIYGVLINQRIDLSNIVNLVIFGAVYVILFGISMWLFGMNEYEKNLVRR